MKKPKPKTYEATVGGRKVRVTVPEQDEATYSGTAAEVLKDVLHDNLSPQAVAALANAVRVQANRIDGRGGSQDVCSQLKWFAEQALALVGNRYSTLCKEAGL